jgi:hypothetical protein
MQAEKRLCLQPIRVDSRQGVCPAGAGYPTKLSSPALTGCGLMLASRCHGYRRPRNRPWRTFTRLLFISLPITAQFIHFFWMTFC